MRSTTCVAPRVLKYPSFGNDALVMMTENDGKNIVHLREYVRLPGFVDHLVRTRLRSTTETGWPVENTTNNLAVWLLWMLTDRGQLRFSISCDA